MMRHQRGNSGFVLLMALLVLAVAATVLASWARRSCAAAARAGSEMERLQARWGAVSCRDLCLPRAGHILKAESLRDRQIASRAEKTVVLGSLTFELVIYDEQAKANVNTLAERHGETMIAGQLAAAQAGGARTLKIRLLPNTPPAAAKDPESPPPPYCSFDQVFMFDHPSQLIGDETGGGPACRLTLWGSGKINFKTAAQPVMRQMTAGVLSETDLAKLIELRYSEPDCTLHEAIKHLDVPRKKAAAAWRVLTDRSSAHSLWVIARGRTRDHYRLYVHETFGVASRGGPRRFEW